MAQLRESDGTHIDLTQLHSCTFVSLVTELLCALDHFSNALPLAQDARQKRLPFDSSSANAPWQRCFIKKKFFLSRIISRCSSCSTSSKSERTISICPSVDVFPLSFSKPFQVRCRSGGRSGCCSRSRSMLPSIALTRHLSAPLVVFVLGHRSLNIWCLCDL